MPPASLLPSGKGWWWGSRARRHGKETAEGGGESFKDVLVPVHPQDNLEGGRGLQGEAGAVLGELQEPEGEELLGSHHNEARLLEEGVQGVGIPAK